MPKVDLSGTVSERCSRAIRAYKADLPDVASELLRSCVQEDTKHHKAWNALGVVLSSQGEDNQALECFENAVRLQPDNSTYQKNLERTRKKISDEELEVIYTPPMKSRENKEVEPENPKEKSAGHCPIMWSTYRILIGLTVGLLFVALLMGGNASPVAVSFCIGALFILLIIHGINSLIKNSTACFVLGSIGLIFLALSFIGIVGSGMLSSDYTNSLRESSQTNIYSSGIVTTTPTSVSQQIRATPTTTILQTLPTTQPTRTNPTQEQVADNKVYLSDTKDVYLIVQKPVILESVVDGTYIKNLEDYVDLYYQSIRPQTSMATLQGMPMSVKKSKWNIGGNEGYLLLIDLNTEIQWYVFSVKEGVVRIVTFTCPASKYDLYKITAEDILKSSLV